MNQNRNNRLLIYFFYDKDGIVDRYVFHMLDSLRPFVRKIIFVSNGQIKKKYINKLASTVDKIIERKNEGFDVYAYKEAIYYEGFDALKKYYEIIMMNNTIMGPLYPFSEMFTKMDTKNIGLWGITKFYKVGFDPFGKTEKGYIREHIQSHFIVCRQNVLKSSHFKKYWETVKKPSSYEESICFHEERFTSYFKNLGFTYATYVDNDNELETINPCPILYSVKHLFNDECRCPIFKRRSFFQPYADVIAQSGGQNAPELLNFIENKTKFDSTMIWENILRLYNLSDILSNLALKYILPRNEKLKTVSNKNIKIALFFHCHFHSLASESIKYIKAMPKYADVYITTNNEQTKQLLGKQIKEQQLIFKKISIMVIPNVGRDIASFLVASKKYIMKYDLICFAHDKKVSNVGVDGSSGEGFAYHTLENVLGSKEYVENIITTFNKNEKLGMLAPPPPIHGPYFSNYGNFWGLNYTKTKELQKNMNLNVPIDNKRNVIAPLGSMFWVRPNTMKKIFELNFRYSDFPKEPLKSDGTILHAIERIRAYIVQDAGYYFGYCVNDFSAKILSSMSEYINQFFANQIRQKYKFINFNTLEKISKPSIRTLLITFGLKIFPLNTKRGKFVKKIYKKIFKKHK